MERSLDELAGRLQQIGWAFAASRVLTVANRVGLLAHLARSGATAESAAGALGLDPLATGKILRALAAQGALAFDQGRFSLPQPLRALFEDGPGRGLSATLEHFHLLYDRWGEGLETWVRTGSQPARPRTADDTRAFVAAMAGLSEYRATELAEAIGIRSTRRMLDLGGALATYAIAFCRIAPELEAVVCDLPEVCALAREEIARAGLSERIRTLPGDFHRADLGDGYDLVLLASIIHQELPENVQTLIHRAAAALAPAGRLAIVDFRIDRDKVLHPFGTLFAVNMRSFGDTYSGPEIEGFLRDAGLEDLVRQDLDEVRWLFMARKRRGSPD